MSATALAERLDGLRAEGRALVVEAPHAVVVSNLTLDDAQEILRLIEPLQWRNEILDIQGTVWQPRDLAEDFAPYRIEIEKPPVPEGVLQVLTNTGFASWLADGREAGVWSVARLEVAFDSWSAHFRPWDQPDVPVLRPATKSPRELVREFGAERRAPADIRPWVISSPREAQFANSAFQTWVAASVRYLMYALAPEVDADGRLRFLGPPRLQLAPPGADPLGNLGFSGFDDLQAAAAWVFENEREAEVRHTLFALEFARSVGGRDQATDAFREAGRAALDGAKIAYQLGLLDLSRESLSLLAELRKSVTEEVGKASDITRQIITAVAGALSVGLGLIAAKLTTSVSWMLLGSLAFVLLAYVLVVAFSGHAYLAAQRSSRDSWRTRLYSYLTGPEYERMVTKPINESSVTFYTVAIVGALLAVVVLAAVLATKSLPDAEVSASSPAAAVKASP